MNKSPLRIYDKDQLTLHSFSEIQIFAVTPSIVRRAQAVSTGTGREDDPSLM